MTSIDRLIGFWLDSKGFPHSIDHAGYWIGMADDYKEETRWYLWTVNNDPRERHSVFMDCVVLWSSGWCKWHPWRPHSLFPREYDLRDPESLTRLERDIRKFLASRERGEEKLLEEFQSLAEGLSDSELRTTVRDLNEFERGYNPTGIPWVWASVKEHMEGEMREIYVAELEWREKFPLF